jgi:hypothetical protein
LQVCSVRKITAITPPGFFVCWIPDHTSANLEAMGSNCQLRPDNRCFERPSAAFQRVRSPTGSTLCTAPTPHPRRRLRDALSLALLLAACGDNGGDPSESSGDTGTPDTSGTDGPSTSPDPTEAPDESGSGDGTTAGDETTGGGEVGPNFGLLTFTAYPADASGSPAQLGMAGAWRTEAFTTDDFYGVRALALFFPLAPADADTLAVNDLSVYDWGKKDTWLALGNGLRLGGESGDALACLQLVEESYPVYLSDDAAFFDPACAPMPELWQPAATYDLVAYGGESYADQTRKDAVTTPAALTVTAPALDVFDFPLAKTADLPITWTADGGADDRVVIRVWDQFGRQIVVHAADDGSYTLAAAELDKLAAGPATLTVARERISELGLAAGTLRVVARHETWAYPDLF